MRKCCQDTTYTIYLLKSDSPVDRLAIQKESPHSERMGPFQGFYRCICNRGRGGIIPPPQAHQRDSGRARQKCSSTRKTFITSIRSKQARPICTRYSVSSMKSWLQSFPAFWAYCTGKVLLSQTQQPCGRSFLGPRVQRAETLLTNGEAKGHVGLSGALPTQAGRYLARFHTLATREAREEGGVGGCLYSISAPLCILVTLNFPVRSHFCPSSRQSTDRCVSCINTHF